MSTMRAQRREDDFPGKLIRQETMLTVRAGESVVLHIAAVDRQSGVAEIVARCRSRQNPSITSVGRWSPRMAAGPAAGGNSYPVTVPIPARTPTDIWELHQVVLRDGEENVRTYEPGRDFQELLFRVQGREEIDHTPPRLLGIRIGTA